MQGMWLERCTYAALTLAFQRALVVLCLSPRELLLLVLPGALSEDLVLMLVLLLTDFVALAALLVDLATLLFEDSVLLLLSGAPLLLPKAICLSFLSLGYKTLLFEHGLTIETRLFLSAQFFVETNLLLSFQLKRLLLAPLLLLQVPLFLEALLLLQLLLASLFGCSTFGLLGGAITCVCLGGLFGFESGSVLVFTGSLFEFKSGTLVGLASRFLLRQTGSLFFA
jgi:hypothetical protein